MAGAAVVVDEKRLARLSELCVEVSERIRERKSAQDDDYALRRNIFQQLLAAGMQRKDIAALAGVEPMTVTYALKPRDVTPSP